MSYVRLIGFPAATLSLFLHCMPGAWGQQPAPADAAPVIRVTSQLVIEVVTVHDRNGAPIKGLTAKDFTVTENGVPQTVSICEFQELADAGVRDLAVRPVRSATRTVEGIQQITPDPPGESRYRDRRLLAFYFDFSTMEQADLMRAFTAAKRFVRTQLTPSDVVAVLEFSNGSVKVRQDFTGDRDQLSSVINEMILTAEGLNEDDEDTGAAFGQNDEEFNIFNTDRQLSALQTTVRMLGVLKEKKALVYFAGGLRLNGVDNQAQLRATLNAAIRSNVAFYPIDTRGLTAEAPMGDATHGSPGGVAMYSGEAARGRAMSFQRSQDTLYALAADTGGKAFLDYNDLSVGIVQAQKAITSYYIIGYYSTNTANDGKFRRIEISLREYPSAKLDYRRGYFAPKEFSKFTAADKERQLEDALMLEDPVTDLTIAMEVNYFQLNRAEYYVPVVMKISGSELVLARRGGHERTVIDFIGEIKDEFNTTVANIRDKVDIKLSGETAEQLARRHIQYDSGYTLLPGGYTIKVLARDAETGRIGTYMRKFTVPNLNKEDKRLPLSSVVLSSQRIDVREALFTAGKDKAQITNPLVQDGQKLIPSVNRVFSKSREMYIYLQAYQPAAETAEPLVAYVTFYRGRVKVFESSPMLISESLNNRLKTMPIKFSVGLENLPPGRYQCQVSVLGPRQRKASFWQAPVMLVP